MERWKGSYGWVGLAAFVIAWDTLVDDTLSAACHRGLEKASIRPLILGGMVLTCAHLANAFERLGVPQADPFRFLGHLGVSDGTTTEPR